MDARKRLPAYAWTSGGRVIAVYAKRNAEVGEPLATWEWTVCACNQDEARAAVEEIWCLCAVDKLVWSVIEEPSPERVTSAPS